MITFWLTTPLILGTLWACIPAFCTLCVSIVRTALEDRTLHEELEGYRGYAERVRYRLLPGVW
jgi:protein-S-isoprenylcysteine O-methyltransferase Ste14